VGQGEFAQRRGRGFDCVVRGEAATGIPIVIWFGCSYKEWYCLLGSVGV
jgi:hypothetical protein